MDVKALYDEVTELMNAVEVGATGEHLWSNYQDIVTTAVRLQEIHNEIAYEELIGSASPELKKFRTMILDLCIERLDKVAQFESRKITGQQMEWELEKRG